MFALAADSVRWEGGEGAGAASGPAQPGLPFIFLSVSDFGLDTAKFYQGSWSARRDICETLLDPRTFPL